MQYRTWLYFSQQFLLYQFPQLQNGLISIDTRQVELPRAQTSSVVQMQNSMTAIWNCYVYHESCARIFFGEGNLDCNKMFILDRHFERWKGCVSFSMLRERWWSKVEVKISSIVILNDFMSQTEFHSNYSIHHLLGDLQACNSMTNLGKSL